MFVLIVVLVLELVKLRWRRYGGALPQNRVHEVEHLSAIDGPRTGHENEHVAWRDDPLIPSKAFLACGPEAHNLVGCDERTFFVLNARVGVLHDRCCAVT